MLITCSKCKKEFSNDLERCPHCKTSTPDTTFITPSITPIAEEFSSDPLYVAGLFCIILPVLLFLVGFGLFSLLQWAAILIPILIYIDATCNGIGKVKDGGRGFTNMSAGEWGGASILLLIFSLPLYLLKRTKLKEKAKLSPTKIGAVQKVLVILSLLISAAAIQWGITRLNHLSPIAKTEANSEETHISTSSTYNALLLDPKPAQQICLPH